MRTIVYNTLSVLFFLEILYMAVNRSMKSVGDGWVLVACAAFCALIGNLESLLPQRNEEDR